MGRGIVGKESRVAIWNEGMKPSVLEERAPSTHKTRESENPLRPKGTEGTLGARSLDSSAPLLLPPATVFHPPAMAKP
jgi:hypothetical protein